MAQHSRISRARTLAAGALCAFTTIAVVTTCGGSARAPTASRSSTLVLDGPLEVTIEDADTGSRTLYFLVQDSTRILLQFRGRPPVLDAGSVVRVTGRWSDNGTAFLVDAIEVRPAPPQ